MQRYKLEKSLECWVRKNGWMDIEVYGTYGQAKKNSRPFFYITSLQRKIKALFPKLKKGEIKRIKITVEEV